MSTVTKKGRLPIKEGDSLQFGVTDNVLMRKRTERKSLLNRSQRPFQYSLRVTIANAVSTSWVYQRQR